MCHWNEFHISRTIREQTTLADVLFASSGNVILANFRAVRALAARLNKLVDAEHHPDRAVHAGQLNAIGLIDEIFHYCAGLYRRRKMADAFSIALARLDDGLGKDAVDTLLAQFTAQFPPVAVFKGVIPAVEYLSAVEIDGATGTARSNRETALEELILLRLANENPAFAPFGFLFGDESLLANPAYERAWEMIKAEFVKLPVFGPMGNNLIAMFKEPVVASPNSLGGQLDYIRTHWGDLLGDFLKRLLSGLDFIAEEEKPGWQHGFGFDLPPMEAYDYSSLMNEYERFSKDLDWMPKVVLLAKTVLVWLTQLSRNYGSPINTLDHIPDEELDAIARRGFTALWLIGIWERSSASGRIKHLTGNPEAAASAYSLWDYEIAGSLGGWPALENLRARLWARGVRLAADMVPNHTGLDSRWMTERPDLFMQVGECSFPGYSFSGENLSHDSRFSVFLEDRYYSKTDCAVVFKRVDNATGSVAYVYHGNDGTGMPWNDTAQIDFLNPDAREEVIQKILHVARNFPIIRFDAAMVLAKKHIRRLWYPEPGHGGDIPSRAEYAVNTAEFEARIPEEFWREVVDRAAAEAPDTLLLAEAFWMMEGYFVRTLGMHRVYNSAFMNMLKKEENQKYRDTIRNTIEFDPQVLKRFVNFMNNPDEDPAIVQFGNGDKYFGVCTLMVTMPGLPMFGHGQIEGFTEKYGMEYTRDYMNETVDGNLIARHEREIFPLMKKRYLFAEADDFALYDVVNDGTVNESVFAYSNRAGDEAAIVFYNNAYQSASGWINWSLQSLLRDEAGGKRLTGRSVLQALRLTGEDGEFCVFREQRTGLWYIRSGADIRDHGLFVSLRGYESQVLLDFSRVLDDGTGRFALLCRELAGHGVADFEEALWDLFLRDLYADFSQAASPSFFTAMADLCAPVPKPRRRGRAPAVKNAPQKVYRKRRSLNALSRRVKSPVIRFFLTLDAHLTGPYGAQPVLQSRPARGKKRRGNTWTTLAWARLAARLERIVSLVTLPSRRTEQTPPGSPAKRGVGRPAGISLEELFVRRIQRVLPDVRQTAAMLSGAALLYSFVEVAGNGAPPENVAALLRHWRFDRKLAAALHTAGFGGYFEDAAQVQALCELLPVIAAPRADPGAAVRALADSPWAPNTLGTNLFGGVRWFNKERTETTLALTAAVLGSLSVKTPVAEAARIYRVLTAAKQKAEYKLDDFVDAFPEKAETTAVSEKPVTVPRTPKRRGRPRKAEPPETARKKRGWPKGKPRKPQITGTPEKTTKE